MPLVDFRRSVNYISWRESHLISWTAIVTFTARPLLCIPDSTQENILFLMDFLREGTAIVDKIQQSSPAVRHSHNLQTLYLQHQLLIRCISGQLFQYLHWWDSGCSVSTQAFTEKKISFLYKIRGQIWASIFISFLSRSRCSVVQFC